MIAWRPSACSSRDVRNFSIFASLFMVQMLGAGMRRRIERFGRLLAAWNRPVAGGTPAVPDLGRSGLAASPGLLVNVPG